MKTYFYAFLFSILIAIVAKFSTKEPLPSNYLLQFANTPPPNCDTTPFNCSANLVNGFFSDAQITTSDTFYYGKTGTDYKDAEFDSSDSRFDDCGVNKPCENNPDSSLYAFTYYPNLTVYHYSCALPVIFIFHPGGFHDCNSIGPGMRLLGKELAKRGYIAVVAEYRRGKIDDPNAAPGSTAPLGGSVYYTSAQHIAAVYRATQDYSGAIRSFIQRQRNNADEFKADTNNIFVSGASAGGVAATLTAYYTQSMIDDVSENVKNALGSIDIDYYKGGINIEYKSKIKGMLSMWTNGFLPRNYVNNPLDFFAQNPNNVPMIAFHGYHDSVAALYTEAVYFSPGIGSSAPFHTITNCLLSNVSSFSVTERGKSGNNALVDEYNGGPLYYYQNIFNQPGTPPMECYVDCQMEHGLDNDVPGFASEFGTGKTNQDDVTIYMAQRTATFFQAVLGGIANKLDRRIFFECENMRYGCDTTDNHESCPPNSCN